MRLSRKMNFPKSVVYSECAKTIHLSHFCSYKKRHYLDKYFHFSYFSCSFLNNKTNCKDLQYEIYICINDIIF